MEYADVVWDYWSIGENELVESVQYEAGRRCNERDTQGAFTWGHILANDEKQINYHKLIMMYRIGNNLVPAYLQSLFPRYTLMKELMSWNPQTRTRYSFEY